MNIGGITNITYLPINGKIIGFDSGPGNILLDHWISLKNKKSFDNLGKWAKSGNLITELLSDFKKEPFFKKKLPKSTGRDLFNIDWLNKFNIKKYAPEDVQRTLLELTVSSANDSIKSFCSEINEIYICGGGSQNKFLIERLKSLTNINIKNTSELGIPSQQVEAIAFAWLADKCLKREHNNSPSITGSKGPRILGVIHYA